MEGRKKPSDAEAPRASLPPVTGSHLGQFFDATRVPDGNVDYAALNTYPLVVLSDISAFSTGLTQQLKSYMNKGGTLLVFPAVDADVASYKTLLSGWGLFLLLFNVIFVIF